jgi:hypothetical protein
MTIPDRRADDGGGEKGRLPAAETDGAEILVFPPAIIRIPGQSY